MGYPTRKLHPDFGIDIEGVDLSKPLTDAQFAEIRALYDEYSVVAIRGHDLAPAAQVAFLRRVGDLVLWDNRASMHSATPANYGGGQRLMHRAYAYTNLKIAQPH